MMTKGHQLLTEHELILMAQGHVDIAAREAWLDQQCAGNVALRDRLRNLLSRDATPDWQLDATKSLVAVETPCVTVRHIEIVEADAAGKLIAGRYRLEKPIGEGGMGAVWLAEQLEPVKRHVAVKLIRADRGFSQAILARFEAERQAIALMDHPHIARLFDAGETTGGAPFFVMEFVKGQPLTDYCDEKQLTIEQRLLLFQQVCAAVQHAHQKGIIHRDLKPSNILVEEHEGTAIPKIIDFGLAKATTGLRLTEYTLSTGAGSILGTPLYMAPEQASFRATDIDTRADVYSLGVILYELLAGSTPITRETLQRSEWDEMLRLIREQDPPPLGQRLQSSQRAPFIAECRRIEVQQLSRMIRGELDWIVQRSLAKERDRRYESPSSLAQDIQRYLSHEPISAGPPTVRYRLQKFVRRNRSLVIAASMVLLALVLGVIGTSWQAYRAAVALSGETKQREIAERRQEEANKARRAAVEAAARERTAKQAEEKKRGEAETNLQYSREGNKILSSIFAGIDPRKEIANDGDLRKQLLENLQTAITKLEGSAIGDPLVVAEMQEDLAHALLGMADYPRAVDVLRKAHATRNDMLGGDDPATLNAANLLAGALAYTGEREESFALFHRTLAAQESHLGEDHIDTMATRNNLAVAYAEAENPRGAAELLERNAQIANKKFGADDDRTLDLEAQLGVVYRDAGRISDALRLLERAQSCLENRIGADNIRTLNVTSNLATVYLASGQPEKGVPLLEKVLEASRRQLGPDHQTTLTMQNNLAGIYAAMGLYAVAVPQFKQVLERQKRVLGTWHPQTLKTGGNLANVYRLQGKPDQALPLLEESLPLAEKYLGPNDSVTLNLQGYLGNAFHALGKIEQALPYLEKSYQGFQALHGDDHPDTRMAANDLAAGLLDSKQPANAIPILQKLIKVAEAEQQGASPEHLITYQNNLLNSYRLAKKYEEGFELGNRTLADAERTLGADHALTKRLRLNLHAIYTESQRLELELPLLEKWVQRCTAERGATNNVTLDWSWELAKARCAAGKVEDGVALFRQVEQVVRKLYPPQDPRFARLLYGGAEYLLKVKEYSLAEAFLRESLAIRQAKEPDVSSTFQTKLLYGESLLGGKKFAEAETHLTHATDKLSTDPEDRSFMQPVLQRIVDLYTAAEKPEEAEKWQKLQQVLRSD